MSDILKLKKQAISLGMDKSEARGANRSTLQKFIDGAGKGGKAPAKKKSGGTTVAKKKANSTTTSTRKKTAPAAKKSATTGKAKRAAKPKANASNGGGRNMIGKLDFSVTDGWNPRSGSPVETIFRAIKKHKGNVDKAFETLKPNIRDFVSTKQANGTKRTKDEMERMLRYRINRTIWQFAMQTGQHEASTDRVQYGTGAYATTRKKATRKASSAKRNTKPNTRKAARKGGRKTAKKR